METLPPVAAVVLSYRRPRNVERIVAGLLIQPFVRDIIIWHNGTHEKPKVPIGGRCLMYCDRDNAYTYGRFLATRFTECHTILTVDDDYLVRNWEALLRAHLKHPEVVTAGLKRGHFGADPNRRWANCHEVLLGFGSVFDKRLIEPTFARYVAEYGHDELLHRKADRLFTMLLNRHHNVLPMDAEELPGHSDGEVALWKRPDHGRLTDEARKRAWKLLGLTAKDREAS